MQRLARAGCATTLQMEETAGARGATRVLKPQGQEHRAAARTPQETGKSTG